MSATDSELEALRAIARAAATLVMEVYATDFTVDMKGHDDPVTRADREANQLICDMLHDTFPEHGILAEESAPTEDAERAHMADKKRVFFVDPVDGTREFANRNGEFCVMIGLAVGGRALAGAVAVPVANRLFWGSTDAGSFSEALDGSSGPARIVLAPIGARTSLRAVVSRSHPSERTQALLARIGVNESIPCGSVGVKAARVLEGHADLYVHPSRGAKLWDACAPEAILRGAHGVLTTLDGSAIDYRGQLGIDGGLIATSSELLPRVLAAVRAA